MIASKVRNRLAELGHPWPPAPPTHQFLPAVRAGELVFVSGHAPYSDGAFLYRGRLGDGLDLSTAQEAAVLALLGCLVSLEEILGTLDAVQRIVKVNGYVRCVPEYEPLPEVTDAASALLIDLFGQPGRHARTTVGVTSLPAGVVVELELIALANGNGNT